MRKPTTNPMQELAKWKANHKAQTEAQAQPQAQAQAVENAPKSVKADGAKGNGKPNFHAVYTAGLSQLNRQFTLANTATAYCKLHYAENYHHKHKLADECNQLRADLKGGKHLLNDMLKPLGLTLTTEQRNALKRFNLAVGYLNYHLKGVAQTVAKIDGLTTEELAQLVASNESKAQSEVANE